MDIATPKIVPTQEEVHGAVVLLEHLLSSPLVDHDELDPERSEYIEAPAQDVRVVLAALAAKERECEELKDRVTHRDAQLVTQQGAHHLAMVGVRCELTAMTARAEAAEARCEALEAACRRQVENIERWLETGEPAGPDESKSIYDQLKAALRAGGGGGNNG